MEQIKSVDYLPELLQNEELFISITNLLDKAIQSGYVPDMESLTSLYNPSDSNYDPAKVIKLLGGETLDNFLNNHTDKTSLSLILSDIHNIKGTEAGFLAVLKLLNLQYESLKFTTTVGGCTNVTLILAPRAVFDINNLRGLEDLTRELFPINLTLVGVTNCLPEGIESLTSQEYDYSVVADYTIMDGAIGSLVPEISPTVYFRICINTPSDVIVTGLEANNSTTHHESAKISFDKNANLRLDYGYQLDELTYLDFLSMPSAIGFLYQSYAESTYANSDATHAQWCNFQPMLDYNDSLDYDLAPLDAPVNIVMYDGIGLDTSVFDYEATTLDNSVTSIRIRRCNLNRQFISQDVILEGYDLQDQSYSINTSSITDPIGIERIEVGFSKGISSYMAIFNDTPDTQYLSLAYNDQYLLKEVIAGYNPNSYLEADYRPTPVENAYDSLVTIVGPNDDNYVDDYFTESYVSIEI